MGKQAIHKCASCGKWVRAMPGDPVVSLRQLGAGFYHYDCAMVESAKLRGTTVPTIGEQDVFGFLDEIEELVEGGSDAHVDSD